MSLNPSHLVHSVVVLFNFSQFNFQFPFVFSYLKQNYNGIFSVLPKAQKTGTKKS